MSEFGVNVAHSVPCMMSSQVGTHRHGPNSMSGGQGVVGTAVLPLGVVVTK